MPEQPQPTAVEVQKLKSAPAFGLTLAPLTAGLRKRLEVGPKIRGVAVTAVDESSPFIETDLAAGDIVVSIDQQAVTAP
jgi:S1-C subfamily serine protease